MSKQALRHALQRYLQWQQRLNDPRQEPGNLSPWLPRLRRWQGERLRASFVDLLADARSHDAAVFFLEDLYSDQDFSSRDRDLARLLPMMARLLPERVLMAAVQAVELSAVSYAFDLRMVRALERRAVNVGDSGAGHRLDLESYGWAYRQAGCRRLRGHQIDLIVQVGQHLDWAVHKHGVERLLRLSRMPAHMAGLGELQAFLERGFTAFRRLDGADDFLHRIAVQEREVSRRLFAGHPRPLPPFNDQGRSGSA